MLACLRPKTSRQVVMSNPYHLPCGNRALPSVTPARSPALERVVAQMAGLAVGSQLWGRIHGIMIEMARRERDAIEAVASAHCEGAVRCPTPRAAPIGGLVGGVGQVMPWGDRASAGRTLACSRRSSRVLRWSGAMERVNVECL
jgi:hypothetical protein